MPSIVAFLDVLGFSSYTEQDFAGALRLLRHQEFILRQKLQDGQLHPPVSYPDASLAAVAEDHLVDSFKHFLPFSDSIFIVSETPDKFVRQLSHFLTECLLLVGHVYDAGDDPTRPEAVEIVDFPAGTSHHENWYPPLWRGGMAVGEVVAGGVTGIELGEEIRVPNVAGPAVVKAVVAEKKLRGPRLLCERGFESNFGPETRRYFRNATDDVSELLWPAFIYNLNNDPRIELFEFQKLWRPAIGLWKYKWGHVSFEHYDEFLKLLVRSLLRWAEIAGCEGNVRENLSKWLRSDLSDELMHVYLEP